MKIFKKIRHALQQPRYTVPVCAILAGLSVVYSGYATVDMIERRDVGAWNLVGGEPIEPQDPLYIPEISIENEQTEVDCDTEVSVFTTQRPIESSPSEQPEIQTEEESIRIPGMLQKPSQSSCICWRYSIRDRSPQRN